MQKGIQNEKDFANLLDGKRLNDLPINMQNLLYALFKGINSSTIIECWQSKYLEKADIKIRINNEIKGISIKQGKSCSLHQENVDKLIPFLTKIGIDITSIDVLYNFIDGKVNNKRVNSFEYIECNKESINTLEKTLNEFYIKTNLILRFVFQGTEIQNYGCDALIYGTPTNFIWATKDELLEYLINSKTTNIGLISIGCLSIKCYDRNLRNNPLKKKNEKDIQIKWYTIKNDLLYISKIREANEILKNSYKKEQNN